MLLTLGLLRNGRRVCAAEQTWLEQKLLPCLLTQRRVSEGQFRCSKLNEKFGMGAHTLGSQGLGSPASGSLLFPSAPVGCS